MYGCDTGCCGHIVEVVSDDKSKCESRFSFNHPYSFRGYGEEGYQQWAEQLIIDEFGTDHGLDLDWDNCLVVDD